MSLVFYHQPISQPSRAVHTLLLIGKVEFIDTLVDVLKGEQRLPEYLSICAAGLVPAIKQGDFTLFESNTILRYLATTIPALKAYYPEDPLQRAQIDCYLDWHHLGFRKPITSDFMWESFYLVKFFGKDEPTNKQERQAAAEEKLALFQQLFLGGEKQFKYIANQPTLSIADLAAHAELSTLEYLNYDFSKFPHLQVYYANISQLPEIKEAYKNHYNIVKQFNPEMNAFALKCNM